VPTPPPPLAPLAILALGLGLGLAGCSQRKEEACPGDLVARLELRGTLAEAGCVVDPPGGWVVPDAAPPDPDPDDAVRPALETTFSYDPGSGQAAFCNGNRLAAVLLGTRTGDHLRLEATVSGAALSACAPGCLPRTTVVVEGDLAGPPGETPTSFSGTLTETLHDPEPSHDGSDPCAPCVLPCTSSYTFTGEAG